MSKKRGRGTSRGGFDLEAVQRDALGHLRSGRLSQAEELFRGIRDALPLAAEAHFNLGVILQARGKLDEAAASYQRALGVNPRYAQALIGFGNLLQVQGKPEEALSCYRRALEAEPDRSEAHNNLGNLLHALGRHAEAVESYRRALALRPGDPDVHANLGAAFHEGGRREEALAHLRQALAADPDHPDANANLGAALLDGGEWEEAATCCRRALAASPQHAHAHNNLGAALQRQGRLEEAMASYRRALTADPRHADAHTNLGAALHEAGRMDEALACYRRALEANPRYAEAHFNRALVLLSRGELEEGWRGYEWRLDRRGHAHLKRNFPRPAWDGSPLGGRTILLHAEQGLGDTLQFTRYVPLVARRGGRVALECQPRLKHFFEGRGEVAAVIGRGEPLPEFDLHAPLLSLPRILGTTLKTIPSQAGYIAARADLAERWKAKLPPPGGLRVGLCWQGNKNYPSDHARSIPLEKFRPLLEAPGASFVSLQKGYGEEQIARAGLAGRIADPSAEMDAGPDAFADTAAIIHNLDLVVTSDTAVAHLAGAMGKPVWTLLAFVPDWRWMLEREDSPWYPTMRLFRQRRPGDWEGVMARAKEALAGLPRRG